MNAFEAPASVVIVGAGHAGFSAAAELRNEGFDRRIVLLDEHPQLPYQRPPLSKGYLAGEVPAAELLFRGEEFYDRERIEYRPGDRCVEIDRRASRVILASGTVLDYDALVLAVGSSPRTPPFATGGLTGVFELHVHDDADALGKVLGEAARLIVVGGGFVGLEVACAARKRGLDVTVLEAQGQLMPRVIGPTLSAYCLGLHRASGLEIRLGARAVGLEGDDQGQVRSVTLDSGEPLAADAVVLGLGIAPRTGLAEKAGLAVDDGVVVNEFLETSDPAISAIGDCASFPYAFDGRRRRLESVQNATDQARNVARKLRGAREPYADVPWFWSDQGDMKLQLAGLGAPGNREVVHGDPASGRFSVLRFAGSRLVAGESVNAASDHLSLRTLVAHGADPQVRACFANHPEEADLRGLARAIRARERR